jgi:uncharacterized protein (TIGR02246 family)
MKTVFSKTTLLFLGLFLTQGLFAQAPNQETFEKYLKEVYSVFDRGGFESIRQYYAPECVEIAPDGTVTRGLSAIEAGYKAFEQIMDAPPVFRYKLTSWRMVTPELAFLTWDTDDEIRVMGQVIKGQHTCSGLVRKSDKTWLIEFSQLTPKTPMPLLSEDEKKTVEALVAKANGCFETLDAKGFASLFTNNADFITPFGLRLTGKKAIEQAHAELFASPFGEFFKNNKSAVKDATFRMMDSTHALYSWTDVTPYNENGEMKEDKSSILLVLNKASGEWLAEACQITPVQPMPSMAAGQ